jgi:hypothetical protein
MAKKIPRSMRCVAFVLTLLWIASCGAAVGGAICRAQDAAPTPCASVVEDRTSGQLHWRLVRNSEHPAGPGRWAAQPGDAEPCAASAGERLSLARSGRRSTIRAGDSLWVVETSEVVDLRLEAKALEPAVVGQVFRVRLEANGKAVFVRALDREHATLLGRDLVDGERGRP